MVKGFIEGMIEDVTSYLNVRGWRFGRWSGMRFEGGGR